jgi:hypothetical protein
MFDARKRSLNNPVQRPPIRPNSVDYGNIQVVFRVPMALRSARIGFRSAREPMTAPPIRSLWSAGPVRVTTVGTNPVRPPSTSAAYRRGPELSGRLGDEADHAAW